MPGPWVWQGPGIRVPVHVLPGRRRRSAASRLPGSMAACVGAQRQAASVRRSRSISRSHASSWFQLGTIWDIYTILRGRSELSSFESTAVHVGG